MERRDWLVTLRDGMPQHEVAALCELSQSYYSWLETGKRNPSVKVAKKIANVLKFDWTNFFVIGEEGEKGDRK